MNKGRSPSAPDWPPRVTTLVSLLVVFAGCGSDMATPTGPTATTGPVTLVITEAKGGRWASSGVYAYEVSYTVENTGNEPTNVTVSSYTIFGPNGEALVPEADPPPSFPLYVGPHSTAGQRFFFSDGNLANPWAERVVLRLSARMANRGTTITLAAEQSVAHGPPIPRVLEFRASPTEVRAGDLLTVRWNVVGATRVRLSRWIADPTATPGPTSVDVEHVGFRTVQIESATRRAITLSVDDWAPEIIDISPIQP